jgi:hypothetical protein
VSGERAEEVVSEAAPELDDQHRDWSVWPFLTVALLTTGWATFYLSVLYTSTLVERWGPAPDVVDALGRDAYVGRKTFPFFSIALLFDLLTVGSLVAPSRSGWHRALKILVAIVLLPTFLLHGLLWLLQGFFALA